MSMRAKRVLLIVLCAVGIPAILATSLLFSKPGAAPLDHVEFTEIMNSNRTVLCDADGKYYDWVEITNSGRTAVSLKGLSLTDNPAEPETFMFGDVILASGQAITVPLTGDANERRNGYAPFGLGDGGDTVYLYRGDKLLDEIAIEKSPDNVSFGKYENAWVWFATPTPSAANGGICAATPEELQSKCYTGVMINEVCAVSRKEDKVSPYDWVEFLNTTNAPINLKGYRFTENILEEGFVFPDMVLEGGERLLVFCDNDGIGDAEGLCAPFSLSGFGETLTLITPEGVVCDRFESGKQRFGITCGRMENNRRSRAYFTTPTPLAENGTGYAGYAAMPQASREGGYATASVSVTLTVPNNSRVYYTTDGSVPNEHNTLYTAGTLLTFTQNTVLRAVAYNDELLPSDVVTQTYLIDEPHDIPVVSVSGDPQALFGGAGVFVDYLNENKQATVHTEYFEANGEKAVAFNSNLRIAGGLSRYNVQKAFSLNLNQSAGQNSVIYPFFEQAKTQEFGNLLLRPSGSDWSSAKLRDEFVAAALDGQDDFVMQAVKPVALYINGRYYGLYYLREKRNEAFIATETGIPEERVEIAKSPAVYESYLPMNADMKELIRYAKTHDLTDEEHYRHVTEQINTKSLMQYYAVQTWFGNGDVINNTAYYRDTENGKWHWVIFDMDWACTSYYANSKFITQLYNGSGQHTYRNYYDPLMTALLKNEDFSREFLKTYKQLMDTLLSPERLLPVLNGLADEIESEIPRQHARYGAPSVNTWNAQIAYMRKFINAREQQIVDELCTVFSLSEEEWAAL